MNHRDFCYDFEPGERIGIVGALAAIDSLRSLCTSSSRRMAGHQSSQHTPLLHFTEHVTTAGPNGAGKSTLLNLIAGSLPPVGGERSVGDTTVLGNFTQHPVDMPEHVSIVGWLRCGAVARIIMSNTSSRSDAPESAGRLVTQMQGCGRHLEACREL